MIINADDYDCFSAPHPANRYLDNTVFTLHLFSYKLDTMP